MKTSPAPAEGPLHTVRLRRADAPDFSSAESLLSTILRPGMTEREKALAIYDFVRQHLFHWPAPREGETPNDHEFGVVYDPVKLLGVYGYGYCFQSRAVLEALWQIAGLEARSAGIGGHSVAEVFFEGRWHYLDADFHGYCLLDDGVTIASIEDLAQRPDLLMVPRHRPDPFYPASADPRVPYESLPILAGYFASREDNFYQHDKIVLGHELALTLLPGMRLRWFFDGDGRWNCLPSALTMERDIGYVDPAEGPKDRFTGIGYARGEMLFQPDLTDRSGEFQTTVWAQDNMKPTPQGLQSATAQREAWAIFRIRLPYPVVGWPTSFVSNAPPVGGAVWSARVVRTAESARQVAEVSTDRGRTWSILWEGEKSATEHPVVDISGWVVRRYEFWIRLRQWAERPDEVRIEALTLRCAFQCAPRSLPELRPGENELVFELGDGTDVTEWRADLTGGTALAQAEEFYNLWIESGKLRSLQDREGYGVFRFDAPSGNCLHRIHLHVGCFRHPQQTGSRDRIRLALSHDAGQTWHPLWQDAYPSYAQHWCYHGNAGATCPPPSTSVWVRLEIRTAPSAAVRDFRVYTHWRPIPPTAFPARGVRILHRWTEDDHPRSFEKIVMGAPDRYTVAIPADAKIRNDSVSIERVRAADLAWREEEARPVPPLTTPDPGIKRIRQTRMRDLLRTIRDDPQRGLAEAAAQSEFEGLSRSARQAIERLGRSPKRPPETEAPR